MMNALARGLSLAHGTSQALDRTGADVVLIARAGQDLSRHGLRWSHVGFAYRTPAPPATTYATSPDGAARHATWRVVHKLNDCGQATSAVYRQGLAQFFNDDPHRYEAALLPLKPEVAARCEAIGAGLQIQDYSSHLNKVFIRTGSRAGTHTAPPRRLLRVKRYDYADP